MTRRFENSLTDWIAGLAPWLAPVPTAWLVGSATMRWLGWPWPVAIVAAVIIESLGLGATATALTLWDYNRSRRKIDPAAPAWIAIGLVGLYFVIAVLLTVLLDVLPGLRAWAPVIFPALSLTGVTVLALRSDHRRRLAAIVQEKAERKAERQARRQMSNVKKPNLDSQIFDSLNLTDLDRMRAARRSRQETRVNRLLTFYQAEPMSSPSQAAEVLGLSRQTVYNYLEKLETDGRIRRNGHGVEVIG